MAESRAELECIVHYDSKDGKYTKIKHISDTNKESIFAAKQLREQLGGANHHEKQCLSIPKDIDPDRHGIHMAPCYKKFTLILSSHKIDPSQSTSTSESRPKRAESSGTSSHVYPKECNFCKKYRVKRKQQHYFPITIDDFTERKGSWVSRAKFDSSNACFNKIFHFCHLSVRYISGSYSLKTLSKFLETTQHLPGTQGFAFSISFSAWTLLNLCASFTNCGLLCV